jgi:hypothetical protein
VGLAGGEVLKSLPVNLQAGSDVGQPSVGVEHHATDGVHRDPPQCGLLTVFTTLLIVIADIPSLGRDLL